MKLLILADLHFVDYFEWQKFLLIDKNTFDVILLLGDIDIIYLKSILENFKGKPIHGVLGNHDFIGDLEYYNISDLNGKYVNLGEISIVGVEGCLKYNNSKSPMHPQDEISLLCSKLPPADIIMSHNSPKGIHDKSDLPHEGYIGLLEYIKIHKPKYCLHGHQHVDEAINYLQTKILGIYGGTILDYNSGELNKLF